MHYTLQQPQIQPKEPELGQAPKSAARFARVPSALVERPQWVTWRFEIRGEKKTKVPYDARTGQKAKADDPATWAPYSDALDAYLSGDFDGIGYEIAPDDGITGIDLDHCIEGGALLPWARAIIDRLNSYTEITPSGAGVRIFVRGKLPPGRRRKGPVEMYDAGRFLTVTGEHLDGAPWAVEERTAELAKLHADTFAEEAKPAPKPRHRERVSVGDQPIIDRVISDPKYARLWSGDISAYGSHSEADLALTGRIAFFVGPDESRIDSIFRQSSLCREKWTERADYRGDTIAQALAGKSEFYEWDRRQQTRSTLRAAADAVVGEEETDVPIPHILTVADLVRSNPELRPALIVGLMRFTEIGNIIAPPKKAKSWLVLYIAICVATGRMIFGRFQVTRARVLLVDNELHPNTLAKRIAAVARAMGVMMDELDGWLDIDPLRGRVRDLYAMRPYFASLESGTYGLIVLDALYRFLPADADENSNAAMTALYNCLDTYAQGTGAAILCVHHTSKGIQAGKSITDVGAGAGAISRAADSHLVLRDHEEEGVVVLDAVARSWEPLEPICLRWEWPLWSPDETLNPDDLRQSNGRRKRQEAPAEVVQPKPEEPWTAERFATEFGKDHPQEKNLLLDRATSAGNLTHRKANALLRLAVDAGHLHQWAYPKDRAVYYATIEQPVTETVGARK